MTPPKPRGPLALALATWVALAGAPPASAWALPPSHEASTPGATLPPLDRLWDFDHPERSEVSFRARLVAPGPGAAARAEARTQLARALGLQGRFAEGHAELDRVDRELLAPPSAQGQGLPSQAWPSGPWRVVQLRSLLERGRLFRSAQRAPQGRPLFKEAYRLALAWEEEELGIDAAHMIALCLEGHASEAWTRKALAWAERARTEGGRSWRASLQHNLAWALLERGEAEEACCHFEAALRLREARGEPSSIAVARWSVGRAQAACGRFLEAIATQEALARELARQGLPPDGYVHEELGECHLALGQAQAALPEFRRALELLREELKATEPLRLRRLEALVQALAAAAPQGSPRAPSP